jgi:hypothetical protein
MMQGTSIKQNSIQILHRRVGQVKQKFGLSNKNQFADVHIVDGFSKSTQIQTSKSMQRKNSQQADKPTSSFNKLEIC